MCNSPATFEWEVHRKMYGPCKDVNAGERRIRKYKELYIKAQVLWWTVTKKRLIWAGHGSRKEGSLLRKGLENAPPPMKKTTGSSKMRMQRGQSKWRRRKKGPRSILERTRRIVPRKGKVETNVQCWTGWWFQRPKPRTRRWRKIKKCKNVWLGGGENEQPVVYVPP